MLQYHGHSAEGGGVGGVGGAGGAPPSATNNNLLVSEDLRPVSAPVTASSSKACRTEEGFMFGSASKMRAAPPDTWGQAMDVPLKVALAVSDLCPADRTLLPGAQIFVQEP